MKIKLLLGFLSITSIALAQTPINSFYGNNNAIYTALESTNPLDHGTGGANQTWNFGPLLSLGQSTYTYLDPTSGETTTYPGTTKVIVTTTTDAYNGRQNVH